MGIRDRPTAARSLWQNGYAERLIGSIRRECLDHVIVFGERHLRTLLLNYQSYYNECRTHLSLDKDAPLSRAVQLDGRITANPVSWRTASSILPNLSFRQGQGHVTVGRRIALLEKRLGVTLLNRTPDGFAMTSAGQAILQQCTTMESAALDIERAAAGC
jgi:hypothetical protein